MIVTQRETVTVPPGAFTSEVTISAGLPTTTPSDPKSLLPSPGTSGLDGVQDALTMMDSLVSKQGNLGLKTGEVSVQDATRNEKIEQAEEEDAVKQEEAEEAQMNSGGGLFAEIGHAFEDIGKDLLEGNIVGLCVDPIQDGVNIVDNPNFPQQLAAVAPEIAEYVGIAAAVIGAAAITACTGGAGGVAVACVIVALSASGAFVSKTQCFGKDSAYIGLGLDVASVVVSCGASVGGLAGGAAGTATAVADAATGAADIGAGISTVVTVNEQADVLDDAADVQAAMALMNRNARLVSDLIDGLKDAQQSNKNALQVLAGAAQTYGQTLTLTGSAAKA